MRITAAVLEARATPFVMRELALAEPGPGQIRVRIHAVGICHTDLSVADHEFGTPLPMVLGHEGAGIVEAVGPEVSSIAPGDRVVLSYAACRACAACDDGSPQYCSQFMALNWSGLLHDGRPPFEADGAPVFGAFFAQSSFATHALALATNAVKVDDRLSFALLAPLGCGMQTGAGTVLNTLRPATGQSLVVFGTGGVGLAALMAARSAGCAPLIAVDLDDGRLALARELGATDTLRGDVPDLAAAIRAIAPDGVDFTIDTTGAPEVIRVASDVLAARGTCALLAVTGAMEASFVPGAMLGGRSIRGVIEGDADPHAFVPRMIAMHAAGDFPFDRLVKTYPFARINEAVADMRAGRTIKPVLLLD